MEGEGAVVGRGRRWKLQPRRGRLGSGVGDAGARPLVDAGSDDKLEIIVQEILQDKIYLDMSNEVKITGEPPSGPLEFDLSSI